MTPPTQRSLAAPRVLRSEYCRPEVGHEAAAGGELIDDLKSGRKKMEEVKDDELPENLRSLPAKERFVRIDELRHQRAQIQQEITVLTRERDEFVQKELTARAKAGNKEGFVQKFNAILTEQAARKGVQLAKNP
jgi:hypothetical protein